MANQSIEVNGRNKDNDNNDYHCNNNNKPAGRARTSAAQASHFVLLSDRNQFAWPASRAEMLRPLRPGEARRARARLAGHEWRARDKNQSD